jgi:hypothetical protein
MLLSNCSTPMLNSLRITLDVGSELVYHFVPSDTQKMRVGVYFDQADIVS